MSCPSDAPARLTGMSASDTTTATTVLTPSGLAARIRAQLRLLEDGRIEGEVRDLKHSGRSVYFTIADEQSAINCIVWRNVWERLDHKPSEGEQVEAHFARVDFYGPYGKLSLHIDAIELAGEGRFLRRQAETL